LVIPLWGWRAAFFIGAIPAAFAAVTRFAIPESPRFLQLKGRFEEASALVAKMEAEAGLGNAAGNEASTTAACDVLTGDETSTTAVADVAGQSKPRLAKLFNKTNLRATITLWVLWFAVNLGYYGFVLWTPSLLQAQGFDMVKSFEFTLLMCVAQLPGYLAAGLLIERIGRKKVLVLFLLGTAASAWFFGQAGEVPAILASGCCLYFFALGTWGCVYSYTPELYPTEIRGTGNGWAAAFGRIGALLGPFIVPWLYTGFGEQQGFIYIFVILMIVFLAAAVVVATLGRETKGVGLSER
jgi:putative MFS transporter